MKADPPVEAASRWRGPGDGRRWDRAPGRHPRSPWSSPRPTPARGSRREADPLGESKRFFTCGGLSLVTIQRWSGVGHSIAPDHHPASLNSWTPSISAGPRTIGADPGSSRKLPNSSSHHLDGAIDVLAVGDADVDHRPGVEPGEVGGDPDLPIGDVVDVALVVPQHGHPELDVFDDPVDAGEADPCPRSDTGPRRG